MYEFTYVTYTFCKMHHDFNSSTEESALDLFVQEDSLAQNAETPKNSDAFLSEVGS